jgi:hypothetical protein
MKLYDEKGGVIEYSTDNYIDSGAYGSVYFYMVDKCIKLLNYLGMENFSSDVYKFIRELKLSNFGAFYDLLYDYSLCDSVLGYLSKYYVNEDIDIITMPTSYTLDNLIGIFKSIITLAKYNIRTLDLSDDNVIINSNGIIVKDIDLYYFDDRLDKEKLLGRNIFDLENLFIDLYVSSIKKYHSELLDSNASNLLYSLFMIDDEKSIDLVGKKLCKYKYPIDYIRKNKEFYR